MINDALPYQSLHGHTVLSDGAMTHEEALDTCAKNNVGVVSITDHDTLVKPEIFEAVKKLNHPVKFISGVELSCDYVEEIPVNMSTFHIVGLFVDPTNEDLIKHCEETRRARKRRLDKYLKNLKDLGFKVTGEQVLKYVGDGGAIGRPHIVKALQETPENEIVIDGMLEKLKEAAKTDATYEKQLNELLSKDKEYQKWAKWFALVMSGGTLFSAHVEYADVGFPEPYLNGIVKLIRNAGGLALIAHWSYLHEKYPFNLEIVEKLMKENRIDGMETVYSFGIEDEKRGSFAKDMEDLSRLCKKYSLVEGGGMDFHRPEDLERALDPKFADFSMRTKNMTEMILEKHPEIDKTWTTL
ncbi:hypothetical protein A2872_04085 [Candidatus Gottesmanbacteria bacterium RIFCSPHIGHO2_01_FULL_42_12]|uniref:Polymerase/histidinol phosphatase N-terminal domain-containing protein n=1 Tax=Candidatus Gottesmanbacteria bacterium RIFCSPHIGHO2_01_FULL_42_12 TaxID=1798377 RepID=A0A1F5Z1Y0_9BACT|nr:MAG: hypothetical protein A2872_04085 [Candidatus Gottesmanbacteria bacterium RIFCSPHIGHO2_01_FULL_42_12]